MITAALLVMTGSIAFALSREIGVTVVAILLANFSSGANAQVDCEGIPAGPERTDCYIGLSRLYQGQSDVAAGNARLQSGAARLQQVTGASRSRAIKHRRKNLRLARIKSVGRSG
jgi:hypothetical protein